MSNSRLAVKEKGKVSLVCRDLELLLSRRHCLSLLKENRAKESTTASCFWLCSTAMFPLLPSRPLSTPLLLLAPMSRHLCVPQGALGRGRVTSSQIDGRPFRPPHQTSLQSDRGFVSVRGLKLNCVNWKLEELNRQQRPFRPLIWKANEGSDNWATTDAAAE